jgi:hypothetical protein
MTNTERNDEKKSVVPIVAASVAVGAVVGALIGIVITGSSGDEAPIKVKNGSLQIHLAHKNQKFKKDNQKWKIDGGGSHGSDRFEVYFAPTPSMATDCAVRKAVGDTIVIRTSDQTSFTLTAPAQGGQNKTEINEDTAGRPLTLEMDDRLLRYGAPGSGVFIESMTVGGQECKMSAYDPGFSALIVDE